MGVEVGAGADGRGRALEAHERLAEGREMAVGEQNGDRGGAEA